MTHWTNTSALVAGGASGLGEATVRRLVAAGALTCVFDLNAQRGQSLAEELGELAIFFRGDVTSPADVSSALDKLAARPLRLSVNCAFMGTGKPLLDAAGAPHDYEKFRRSLDINVTGAFNIMRLAAAHMAASGLNHQSERGVIVNVASIGAFDGPASTFDYTTSKAAIAGMTLTAARDLAPHAIRVMTIAPGSFITPMTKFALQNQPGLLDTTLFPPRFGDPDEFAKLVMHIADNPYLNGETIRLDGGARLFAPPRG